MFLSKGKVPDFGGGGGHARNLIEVFTRGTKSRALKRLADKEPCDVVVGANIDCGIPRMREKQRWALKCGRPLITRGGGSSGGLYDENPAGSKDAPG